MSYEIAYFMVERRVFYENYADMHIDSLTIWGDIAAVRGRFFYSDGYTASFRGQLRYFNGKWKIVHMLTEPGDFDAK
ncbi:MAG: hypothetical protein JXA33_00765 [Anaerolineae bacterium]|nr:hypothetical protein [Anaerolineae bacterium]